MAQTKIKNKYINYFDLLVLVLIIIVGVMSIFSIFIYKKPTDNHKIRIVLSVPSLNIEKAAESDKLIYLNGVDSPVKVISVIKESENLLLTLEAPGKIENNIITFNGQRIAINQKAEIHDSYFAQGRIISASDE